MLPSGTWRRSYQRHQLQDHSYQCHDLAITYTCPTGPSDSTLHILSHQNFNCHHHKPRGPRHSHTLLQLGRRRTTELWWHWLHRGRHRPHVHLHLSAKPKHGPPQPYLSKRLCPVKATTQNWERQLLYQTWRHQGCTAPGKDTVVLSSGDQAKGSPWLPEK